MLFVGDAAGVVDPMTGEGIAQAIETGMLAAEAIATGADYARLVHRALGRDLRFAATAADSSCAVPSAPAPRSRAADLTPWTRRNFARWMWEDYPAGRRSARPTAGTAGCSRAPGAWRADRTDLHDCHDGPMADGTAEISIDRSPDDVWKLVREFGGLADVDARRRVVHRRRRRAHDRA